ncbi:hydrolase Nlp/P60 [Capnocytophaga cynodegmi]|uniref:C40 family peptidase n=1 Tax=Capnocytophaga cynodegmi TaxID=28189 RepID=UPI001EE22281|nr:C40 family peptidase [Capnocytophaga cynodegmi]GJQ06505.1 hydrolase Nlp/P60 [Capnocytophaga cynodegmi]
MSMKILYTPYGICHLSVVPVRLEPFESTEMITQLLFGELLQVIETQENWSFVRIIFDGTEGWVLNNQFTEISDKEYRKVLKKKDKYAHRLMTKLRLKNAENSFLYVPKGATFSYNYLLNASQSTQKPSGVGIISTAFEYLNVPYLLGGRTPFGIDASGFVQIVYKLNGINLLRTPEKQSKQGELVGFIEETIPGDLAFFDDEEGNITHVGILLGDNQIIHSYGKVRVDKLDHIGIFNSEIRNYTHKLRLMRRIL